MLIPKNITRQANGSAPIGVGLYGNNGHQIQSLLDLNPCAELVSTAAFARTALTPSQQQNSRIRHGEWLDDLLKDERVALVALCSSRRCDQAQDAIRCLEAGRHVYAEKPSALTEADLDAILTAVQKTGCQYHEMADTAFVEPFWGMKRIVDSGVLGTIVQVFAQKSYPWHDRRPQDEELDGGLILQNGIHALRFVEHVAGLRVVAIAAIETTCGNPIPNGGLRMAASLSLRLSNGGVGSIIANYLHQQPATGTWGNEQLRIFGTHGFIETVDGARRTRLCLQDQEPREVPAGEPQKDFFSRYIDSLLGHGEMPLSLAAEVHPTRMVIRAKRSAESGGIFISENQKL